MKILHTVKKETEVTYPLQYAFLNRFRSEIEEAARDSRQLADDLAGMLARLEGEDEEGEEGKEAEKVVVAGVLKEDKNVEAALQEMIQR